MTPVSLAAGELAAHFLRSLCRTSAQPVLIVSDVTTSGEIDDSISLLMYYELERRGCIEVIGVVAIRGNGGASTTRVRQNLILRLHQLGIDDWQPKVLSGPERKSFGPLSSKDRQSLQTIAARINSHKEAVVIAELGPMTVSARLLMHSFVSHDQIQKILGVGGREKGERFATGKGVAANLFGFRDMNVAEDTNAFKYLLSYYASKIWLVTYKTGVGQRVVTPMMIARDAPILENHAKKRYRTMHKWLGYNGIPSWDTWTTSYFLENGAASLGCVPTRAAMRFEYGGFRDPMQLWLNPPAGNSYIITACHNAAD